MLNFLKPELSVRCKDWLKVMVGLPNPFPQGFDHALQIILYQTNVAVCHCGIWKGFFISLFLTPKNLSNCSYQRKAPCWNKVDGGSICSWFESTKSGPFQANTFLICESYTALLKSCLSNWFITFGTDKGLLVQYKTDTQKLFSLLPFHQDSTCFLGDCYKVVMN